MKRAFIAVWMVLSFWPSRAAADEVLTFLTAGKETARISKTQLIDRIKVRIETFFDPDYRKMKTYRCLPLVEVMNLAYGPAWQKSRYTEAVLSAADGFTSVVEARRLAESGGCLAIGDEDFPHWQPIGRKHVNPGPFYLTWSGKLQTEERGYPWPYQLLSVNLVTFEERFPEVVPQGAPEDSAAYRGYDIFKNKCISCHSINQQGGKTGPDLNAPQSITAYRSKEMIKAYIRQPSKFRYTEMPDHTGLTDLDLEDLYQYFLFKSKQPEKKEGR